MNITIPMSLLQRCRNVADNDNVEQLVKDIDEAIAAQSIAPQGTEVQYVFQGRASPLPGTPAFTMAVFNAKDVPVGTKLYTRKPL